MNAPKRIFLELGDIPPVSYGALWYDAEVHDPHGDNCVMYVQEKSLRWTNGGNGSHWDGCTDVHYDCRIAQLEGVIKILADKLLFHPVDYMSIQEYNNLVRLVQRTLRTDDFAGDSDHEHDDRIL